MSANAGKLHIQLRGFCKYETDFECIKTELHLASSELC